jgi:hypothetical protein
MGWVVNITSGPLDPWESPGTHCVEGWVGLMAGLDGSEKSRPPLGFDPRTVNPVTSRYTHYVIPALIQKLFHVNTYIDNLTVHIYIYIKRQTLRNGLSVTEIPLIPIPEWSRQFWANSTSVIPMKIITDYYYYYYYYHHQ